MFDRSAGRGREDPGRSPLARSLLKSEHNLKPRSRRMRDGHPYVIHRAVNQWIRAGVWREDTVRGPNGNPFKVLTATRAIQAKAAAGFSIYGRGRRAMRVSKALGGEGVLPE